MPDPAAQFNLYDVLGAKPSDDFTGIKRAYYRRAKECHPDRFGGDNAKEEEFKQLLAAFDVLSDPLRRREYDARHVSYAEQATKTRTFYFTDDDGAIMDSFADDTLEELVVGNHIPATATLQTLMRDLENTEKFCRFREAKNLYHSKRVSSACSLFTRCMQDSPHNILYRYYLARCYATLCRWREAEKQLKIAIQVGAGRQPPLRLNRIRQELDHMRRQHGGLISRWRAPQSTGDDYLETPPEVQMAKRIGRTMDRLARELDKREQRRLPKS